MSRLDDLNATLDGLIAQRKAMAEGGPKPSYSIDGQTVNWQQYWQWLSDEIDKVAAQINANDPVEIQTLGGTGGPLF